MSNDQWMTYADAAAALGMTTESVRQRARREAWRKQIGNGGKALILVPGDTDRIPPGDTVIDTSEAPGLRPVKRPDPMTDTALQARVVEMEIRATELRVDLDRERAERLQERERAEKLVGEVADLARQLARVAEEAGARERALQGQLGVAEGDLAAMKARTVEPRRWWWQRRAG